MSNQAWTYRERCQVLELTRQPAIRMNPSRLPPLTKAQQYRIKLFRQEYKSHGKVFVARKGQKLGHILITVTIQGERRCFTFDPDGQPVARWTQYPLHGLGQRFTDLPNVATTPYQED